MIAEGLSPGQIGHGIAPAPVAETGELVRPLKIVLIGGSFFRPQTMQRVADYLTDEHGLQAEVFHGLPTQEEDATGEDHINALTLYLEDQQEQGFDVVAAPWSGGSGHLEAAMERVRQRHGSQPVRRVVAASPTLEPPRLGEGESSLAFLAELERNSELFREGITRPDPRNPRFVEYNPAMAEEVFFNDRDSHEISPDEVADLIADMIPQYRVDPSPLPSELNADWDCVFGIRENVRMLGALTMLARRYAKGRHKMSLILTEGDHSLPLTQFRKFGEIIVESCVKAGLIRLPEPDEPDFPSAGALPAPRPRRAPDDVLRISPQQV